VILSSDSIRRAAPSGSGIVLELGRSDPFIVYEDADIEKASTGAVKGRLINCRHSFIVSEIYSS
jgi:acyl-CoA reductase-like NAD-dependent aldehyde dehydrogenase